MSWVMTSARRARGFCDVADIADTIPVRRTSKRDAAAGRAAPLPLSAVGADAWRLLAERAIEPNGYGLADWQLAASNGSRVFALCAAHDAQLTGILPVVSMWGAYRIPLPALVSADPFDSLCTPLLDRNHAETAALQIMQAARAAGAHALIVRKATLDGPAMRAFGEELRRDGLRPLLLQPHLRAALNAGRDAEELLQEALGAKKLKELRRQRNRLAEHGAVHFDVARTPQDVTSAVETFLALEASGWKGRRGTAMAQRESDTAFLRLAAVALAARGQCEIVTLRAGDTPVAAGVVLRHLDRAFFFKLGIDERFARYSPGVQLTLELTRHLCADPAIRFADSTAAPDHPMINPIWRERLAIGDVLIPLHRRDPAVPLIRAALALRRTARGLARRAVHLVGR